MNCSDTRPLLDLLCDNVLDAKDTALVLDHLDSCDQCRQEHQELENLRSRFTASKDKPEIPANLMDNIFDRLAAQENADRKLFLKKQLFSLPALAIAAALLLVGVFFHPWVDKVESDSVTAKLADANTLTAVLAGGTNLEPAADRSDLVKKLGYGLKYLKLPSWSLQKSGVYRTPSVAIARFDFQRTGQLGAEHLSCYQAQQGAIIAPGSTAQTIGTKLVHFGNHGKLQYALWSQNGRDYLFVTALSKTALEDIIRGT